MLSRSIFLTIVLCTVFMGNSPSVASDHTYANEVEIVFEMTGRKFRPLKVPSRYLKTAVIKTAA